MIGEPGVPHAFGECTSYMFSSFSLSDIPGADEEFRSRARDLAASAVANMPMDRRARSWMGFDAEFSRRLGQIGRASCRERVFQYVYISVVAVSFTNKNINTLISVV